MAETTCPKCTHKSDDSSQCSKCGIDFNEYASQKNLKLGEVSRLLSESKFAEAKQIAEQLPVEFPDNRNDFLLLLTNINRDISIVEKSKLAQKCCDEGDYVQASLLLRNIKAFDKKLDENVISLRRRIERQIQTGETYSKAVEAYEKGNYGTAKNLFDRVNNGQYLDEITWYLEKIEEIKGNLLNDAVLSIKDSQLKTAENKLEILRTTYPEFSEALEGYSTVVARRIEIQNSILDAAKKAQSEKRYLEAKILYLFLSIRFPDAGPEAHFHVREIGDKAIITLADLNDFGIVDLAELGLDADIDGSVEFLSVPGGNKVDFSTGPVPDFYDEEAGIAAAETSHDAFADTVRMPTDFGGVEVADFVF